MADMLITVPDSILHKLRNSSTRTETVSVALENAVMKGVVLPEGSAPLIISAIRKYELIHEIAMTTNTPFEEVSEKLDQMNREFRAMADRWSIEKEVENGNDD